MADRVIITEDLGNLRQVSPEILAYFTRKSSRLPGSRRQEDDPKRDNYGGYHWDDVPKTPSLLAPLSNDCEIRSVPLKSNGKWLRDLVYENAIIIFVANGEQIAFISAHGPQHPESNSNYYSLTWQFVPTSKFDQLFDDKAYFAKADRSILDHFDAADAKDRTGRYSQNYRVEKVTTLKMIIDALLAACLAREVNCSLLIVGKGKRNIEPTDPRRPAMPGEPSYDFEMAQAKKSLVDRLNAFKSTKNSFATPEELIAALRAGRLQGVDKLSFMGVPYVVSDLSVESFGRLLFALTGFQKDPKSYGPPVPHPPASRVEKGIKYSRLKSVEGYSDIGTPAEGVYPPSDIVVYYEVADGALSIPRIELVRAYRDPNKEKWMVTEDEEDDQPQPRQRGRKPETAPQDDGTLMALHAATARILVDEYHNQNLNAVYDRLLADTNKIRNKDYSPNPILPMTNPFAYRPTGRYPMVDLAINNTICRLYVNGTGPSGGVYPLMTMRLVTAIKAEHSDEPDDGNQYGKLLDNGPTIAMAFVKDGLSMRQMDWWIARVAAQRWKQMVQRANKANAAGKKKKPTEPVREDIGGLVRATQFYVDAMIKAANAAAGSVGLERARDGSMGQIGGHAVKYLTFTKNETGRTFGVVAGVADNDDRGVAKVLDAAGELHDHFARQKDATHYSGHPVQVQEISRSPHLVELRRIAGLSRLP